MSNSTLSKRVFLAVALATILLFASNASALSISARFNAANSSLANGYTILGPDSVLATPVAGDVVALDVVIENAPADVLSAIFASLVYDTSLMTFLGGAYSNVLTETSCLGFLCSPATLTPGIPVPISKPNSPLAFGAGTEDWIQAVAHTNVYGANGVGPDTAALIAFQFIGSSSDRFIVDVALTPGDAIAGAGGSTFAGPVILNGFSFVPEPGTALLLGLGLVGLGSSGRRRP